MENTLAYLQHDRTSFHRPTKILLAATKTLNIKLAASISSKDDQGSNMSNSLERNSCDKLTVMKKRNTNDDCDGKCIALQSFMFMFPLYFIQLSVVQCVCQVGKVSFIIKVPFSCVYLVTVLNFLYTLPNTSYI